MNADRAQPIDAKRFRRVLGHHPTGVAAVTAIAANGRPVGMAVGAFTSVSLSPPLVGFLPDKSSTTWPKIRESGSFCVNVLGAGQEMVCQALATRAEDKFNGLAWRPAPSGSPILDGVVAWIDCDIAAVSESGDHYFVTGSVRELDIVTGGLPLVFFQGILGQFALPGTPD